MTKSLSYANIQKNALTNNLLKGTTALEERKRRFGDRKDGYLLRDVDAMHYITPIIYPNRCDNEAYVSETIDLTNLNAFIAKKNAEKPEFKYTLFHAIVTAVLKTITLRPRLNRFIANSNLYMRNKISASFIVKKRFNDKSEEGLAFIKARPDSTFDTIHDAIKRQVIVVRDDKQSSGSTQDSMDIINKMPRFLSKAIVRLIMWLEKRGKCPQFLIADDPYYASVILSNLGSIKLNSGYHHLTNWGTCSIFVVVGEKALRPKYNADGTFEMREMLDLGLTIDERIADGYYFSKSIRLLKLLLENPELLEAPLSEEVDFI